MNSLNINVNGISNSQMKTSLKNALEKIEGIQSIEIDKALGTVSIEFNDPANEAEIKNCIEQTGFSLT